MGNKNTRISRITAVGRRAAALMLATSTALVTVLSGGVMTAYGAETTPATNSDTSKVTVYLSDVDNGNLSFDGSDERSMSVESGSEVTVNVEGTNGFEADVVSVVNGEGDVKTVKVDDNKALVKAEEDVTVVAAFSPQDMTQASDVALASVDEKAEATGIEARIIEHMNSKYVGKGKELSPYDIMMVTTTTADGSKLENKTLDGLWEAEGEALTGQGYIYSALYEVSKDSDYLVAYIGSDIDNAELAEALASENNADAKMREDVIFDKENGLVYVPKAYTTTNDAGERVVGSTRVQLLYVTKDAETVAKLDVDVETDNIKGDVVDNGVAEVDVNATFTEIKLAKDDKAQKSIDGNSFDEVRINGIPYDAESGIWVYDDDRGVLTLSIPPVSVQTVEVKMSNSAWKDVTNFFGNVFLTKSFAAPVSQPNMIGGTFEFPSTPSVGQKIKVSGTNTYNVGGESGYIDGAIANYYLGNMELPNLLAALGLSNVDLSNWNVGNSIERTAHIPAQTVNGISIPEIKANLVCAHAGIGIDFTQNGFDQAAMSDNYGAQIRVMSVNGNTAIVGIVNPTMNTQAGFGFFTITWKNAGGYVNLVKKSAKPEYTNNNPAFDLTGAKYGIYKDAACTQLAATLTVQNNTGVTNTSGLLSEGTYYAKELPGSAKGYLINNNVRAISVKSGQTTSVTLDGDMLEPILDDPVVLLVQKGISTLNEAGEVQGDIPSLAGVKFRVDYYPGLYNSASAAAASGKATHSAVFATDNNGLLLFRNANPVDGTSWGYKTGSGNNAFPLGTVVITEVSSIEGLIVKGDGQVFQVLDNGKGGTTLKVIGEWPKQSADAEAIGSYTNTPILGGVTVEKRDKDTNRSEPQGNADLADVTYNVINKSKNAVTVNGKSYAVGDVVMTIKTKYDSTAKKYIAVSGEKVLPYGTYQLLEVGANNTYNVGGFDKTFEIRKDGQMVNYIDGNANLNPVMRGAVVIEKQDNDTGRSEPQGDGNLEGIIYDITNKSKNSVVVNGAEYANGAIVMSITTKYDATLKKYVAVSGDKVLPIGSYEISERAANSSYLNGKFSETFNITADGQVENFTDGKASKNPVKRGSVLIEKRDEDTRRSEPQGDANLENIPYDIINKSAKSVVVGGKEYGVGEVVMTITTKYDSSTKSYIAATPDKALPYGTYDIVETAGNNSYLNGGFTASFTIREDGQKVSYVDNNASYNPVMRGGIIVGKADEETHQYLSLGEADLAGTTYEVINQSKRSVVVDGKEYKVGEVVKTIAVEYVDGKYVATTGERALPYGTYDLREIKAGKGYLLTSVNKADVRRFTIREDGQMVDWTSMDDAYFNQVMREDWYFQKKAEDTMERMNSIAFLVTSNTTGEKHIIVTDENGTWGSAWNAHSNDTNANDPTAVNTNGAVTVDADGNWVVIDSSKLDSEAGTWFTGVDPEVSKWTSSTEYDVNGVTAKVQDNLRAFPYDTYTVEELRCDNNVGYGLVTFTVTLHKYGNHDGEGIEIDYGTVDDRPISIGTTLTYGENSKVAPAAAEVKLTDTVAYEGLNVGTEYTLKGELHGVDAEGKDTGVIAEGETTFVAKKATGEVEVEFTVDTSKLGGQSVVAFEYLYNKGAVEAKHEDIEDKDQTVIIPEIGTTLTGDIEHEANGMADTITLTDTVSYKNLEVGKNYVMNGTLMDKATGEAVVDKDGKVITASTIFAPASKDGTVDVVFTFTGVEAAGKTFVAFESVEQNGVEYAVHADIDDEDQTVTFPDVHTKATDKVDGDQEIMAAENQVIVDTVELNNLVVGKEYTVTGTLHMKNVDGTDGGALKDADSNEVTASEVFTADKSDMNVDIEFTIDASALAGKDVVAFETLSREGITLGVHADITDEGQTIHIPKIGTTLTDENGSHELSINPDVKASSTVKPEETEDATAVETEDTETEVDVKTKVDVVEDVETEVTEDVQDEDNAEDTIKTSIVDGTIVRLVDVVKYENLTPGKEYTVNGTLHVRDIDEDGNITDAGALKDADGKEVVATAKFTPEEKDGTVEVVFEFDAAELGGKSVTAYEEVLYKDQIVAVHADITDDGQTVHFVEIGTTALDGVSETHTMSEGTHINIVDEVAYSNLTVGNKYTVSGSLHVQKVDEKGNITDGGVLKNAKGEEVVASTEFVAETANGTVNIVFDFDIEAGALDGSTVVAFEDIKNGDLLIATHSDITDEGQSVRKMKVGTTLTGADGKAKDIQVADKVELVDTVEFENLVIGEEYTLKGVLVDGEGKALKDANGKEVVAESKFTPKEVSGKAEMVFTVDTSKMENGAKIVAYEYVYSANGTLVGKHEDLSDANQTVTVKKDSETPKEHVDLQTGIDNYGLIAVIGMLLLAAGAVVFYIRKRRTV